jgi:hypothetical protein
MQALLSTCFTLLIISLPHLGWSEDSCQLEDVPVNLFQIHSFMDENDCLTWKIRTEPNYIALGTPSHRIPHVQDELSWGGFDQWQFCYDSQNTIPLENLLRALSTQGLGGGYHSRIRRPRFLLQSLVGSASRGLRRHHQIRKSGVFFFAFFPERVCRENNRVTEATYETEALQLYEERMASYHQMMEVISEHFTFVENHSFLPMELD